MRSILVLSFALMAFGSFVDSAGAGGRGWGVAVSCVDPDEYGYDGYKPPLMYYRAYYGDTPICRYRWHRIHARSQG